MQKYKMTRLAAYMVVAVGLAACGANGGDGSGDGGGGGGDDGVPSFEECVDQALANGNGAITSVQVAGCRAVAGTPAGAVNDVLQNLLRDSVLGEELINQINDLTPEELNQLLDTLTGDEALGPVLDAVQGILAALNGGSDPADIASGLQDLLGGAGGDTGTPLDQLGALGEQLGSGGDDPAAALQELLGIGSGSPDPADCGNGNPGSICAVYSTTSELLGGVPVTDEVNTLLASLIYPNNSALQALTTPLDELTANELAQVNDIIVALTGQDDSALTPVEQGLNGVLGELLGGLTGAGAETPLESFSPEQLQALLGGLSTDQLTELLGSDGASALTDALAGTPLEPVGGILGGLLG